MSIQRIWVMVVAAVCLSAAGSAVAQKQAKAQKKGGVANLAVLPVDAIDAAVKLTPDQKVRITAIHDKYRTDAAPLRPVKGVPADPSNTQKLRALTSQANSDILAALTP